jgi:hypothetical protein
MTAVTADLAQRPDARVEGALFHTDASHHCTAGKNGNIEMRRSRNQKQEKHRAQLNRTKAQSPSASQVLETAALFPSPVPLLFAEQEEEEQTVELSTAQCACLLANMLMLTLPKQPTHTSASKEIDFRRLLQSYISPANGAKLLCVFNYFDCIAAVRQKAVTQQTGVRFKFLRLLLWLVSHRVPCHSLTRVHVTSALPAFIFSKFFRFCFLLSAASFFVFVFYCTQALLLSPRSNSRVCYHLRRLVAAPDWHLCAEQFGGLKVISRFCVVCSASRLSSSGL